ncbi:hypothetical protein K5549_017491, partial [Capra hircus]
FLFFKTHMCLCEYFLQPAEDEFPDLSGHNNHMAKVLTPELYAELRAKSTSSGFTVDDVIQTGVDNPGTRASVPRAGRWSAWAVSLRSGPPLGPGGLTGLQPGRAGILGVRGGAGVRASSSLSSLDGDLAGRYYALKSMTEAEQQQLIDDHFLFDKPVSPLLLASG